MDNKQFANYSSIRLTKHLLDETLSLYEDNLDDLIDIFKKPTFKKPSECYYLQNFIKNNAEYIKKSLTNTFDLISNKLNFSHEDKRKVQSYLDVILSCFPDEYNLATWTFYFLLAKIGWANYLFEDKNIEQSYVNKGLAPYTIVGSENIDKNIFYRGQINKNWKISPSITRGIKSSFYFNFKNIENLLNMHELNSIYSESFPKRNDIFHKYSFIQHACSYSPLIDLTYSLDVARVFATSNRSVFNDFLLVDAIIYVFKKNSVLDNFIEFNSSSSIADINDFFENNYWIAYINEPPCFGKTYKFREAKMVLSSYNKIFNALKPKLAFFDIQNNDREHKQKGLFFCPYACWVFNNNLCLTLNKSLNFSYWIFTHARKKSFLDNLLNKRNNHSSYRFLLDPYLPFNE